VVIELDVPENANGVHYALGSAAGGLTVYMADGYVCYEYSLFILQRARIRSEHRLPTGGRRSRSRWATRRPDRPDRSRSPRRSTVRR
jgi:arylsulfatase